MSSAIAIHNYLSPKIFRFWPYVIITGMIEVQKIMSLATFINMCTGLGKLHHNIIITFATYALKFIIIFRLIIVNNNYYIKSTKVSEKSYIQSIFYTNWLLLCLQSHYFHDNYNYNGRGQTNKSIIIIVIIIIKVPKVVLHTFVLCSSVLLIFHSLIHCNQQHRL